MKEKNKPRRSLRTFLIASYLLIATLPVLGVSYYIYIKFQAVLNEELVERLKLSDQSLVRQVNSKKNRLSEIHKLHLKDQVLYYYLLNEDKKKIGSLVDNWAGVSFLSKISVFDRLGYQFIERTRQSNAKKEVAPKKITKSFLKLMKKDFSNKFVDYRKGAIDLILFSKIKSKQGNLLGYIEETVSIDRAFIKSLSKKLGVNIYFYDSLNNSILASHRISRKYSKALKAEVFNHPRNSHYIDSTKKSYVIKKIEIPWGENKITLAIGLSPKSSEKILENMAVAIGSALLFVFLLIVILSIIMSRFALRPLSELVDVIQNMELGKEVELIDSQNKTEIGLLADSFNEMSRRIYKAQLQLVHSEKMAGLGQLVAGVAHELNNPISFIYSNMKTLKEYSDTLIRQIELAINDSQTFMKQLDKAEIDYIITDMPDLIKSCEDGAQRTKEIVLGLRSFSRLDEGDLKIVDINTGIENTLVLLNSELKSKIKVTKNLTPEIMVECFPSQINQVVMNILNNAIQAIGNEGSIVITTISKDNKCIINIEDSGEGMSSGDIEHVFEPFYTTKEIGKGTGLGMSISYGIIQKHKGEIKIESVLGKGTKFSITLPKEFNE